MKQPEISKKARPMGTCSQCGKLMFQVGKRLWFTCTCPLDHNVGVVKTGSTPAGR